jgi:hypothetical protein
LEQSVVTRRRFNRQSLVGLGVLAAPTLVRATAEPARSGSVFHGVASGDPLAERVMRWTRISTSAAMLRVRWAIATDEGFKRIVNQGEVAALPAHDHTVKVDADGLSPGRTSYYRFTAGGATSPTGRTVEMVTPAVSSPSPYADPSDVLEREQRTMARPHIDWVEFRSRGYLIVDLTPERARGEWWLQDGSTQRGTPEHLAAALKTRRGRNHLVAA